MNNKIIIGCPNCSQQLRIPAGKHIKFTCTNCNEKLEYGENKTTNTIDKTQKTTKKIIINILSVIVIIPLFLFIHKIVPELNWKFNTDRLLLFVIITVIVQFLFKLIESSIIVIFFSFLMYLTVGTIREKYGFINFYQDYVNTIFAFTDKPKQEIINTSIAETFYRENDIKNAIDFENAQVREFAIESTKKHFYEEQNYQGYYQYRNLIQYFAIFKEINSQWNYVNDPLNREYFAKASESIRHLSGDCDDHSILMAASIKAIGGKIRLIHTDKHLYPELYIGKIEDLKNIQYLIKKDLFRDESKNKDINYHMDENEDIWLNLDYTEKYPGGEYMNENIIGILTLD